MLSNHREQIRRAYYATSFDPDKKADYIIREYGAEQASIESPELQSKYEHLFLLWMAAESRCMSSAVTGPANFPIYSNEKKLGYARSAYEKFRAFVEKIGRVRVPILSPEDDLEAMLKKLEILKINHQKMKDINKILRSKAENKYEQVNEIIEMTREKFEDSISFPQYILTNNLAKIKTVEERIEALKNRIEVKAEFEPIIFAGGKIYIQDDRVLIKHDQKPERNIIDALKSRGFHWAPSVKAWSRKHTVRALYDAKNIVGVVC